MWLRGLFGSKSKAEQAVPVPAQAEETGQTPPSPADTHQVNTAAIVHRAQVPPAGPTYAGQPIPFYPNRE
ncbi:hypothetical protein OR60_22465, partial [Xanthomonas vesicatoria]